MFNLDPDAFINKGVNNIPTYPIKINSKVVTENQMITLGNKLAGYGELVQKKEGNLSGEGPEAQSGPKSRYTTVCSNRATSMHRNTPKEIPSKRCCRRN